MAELYFKVEAEYQKLEKMNAELAKLKANLADFNGSLGDFKTLNDKIDNLTKQIEELGNKAAKTGQKVKDEFKSAVKEAVEESDDLGEAVTKATDKLAKLGVAFFAFDKLKDLVSTIINVRSEIQSLQISFNTLLGSQEKANQLFSEIMELEVHTPLMMNQLAGAAQMMLGFNIPLEQIMPNLAAIGNIAMGDANRMNSLTLAFSQMSATGKLMGQDLLQMINAGFNPLTEISRKTGKSVAELKEEMSKGKISADMVRDAFISVTDEGGKFHGMLEAQSQTLSGVMSTLEGKFQYLINDIGTSVEGTIISIVKAISDLLEHMDTVKKVLGTVAIAYGTYKAAVMANWIAMKYQAILQGKVAKASISEALSATKVAIAKGGETKARVANATATATETSTEVANVGATTANTAATVANTGAEITNMGATTAQAGAKVAESGAEVVNAEATTTNTGAKVLNTMATNILVGAINALNLSMLATPWGATIALIGACAGAMYLLHDNTNYAAEGTKKADEAIKGIDERIKTQKERTDALIAVLKDSTISHEEHKEALDRLKATYPGLLEQYKNEKDALNDLAGLQKKLAVETENRRLAEIQSAKSVVKAKIVELNTVLAEIDASGNAQYQTGRILEINKSIERLKSSLTKLENEEKAQAKRVKVLDIEHSTTSAAQDKAMADRIGKALAESEQRESTDNVKKLAGIGDGKKKTYVVTIDGVTMSREDARELQEAYSKSAIEKKEKSTTKSMKLTEQRKELKEVQNKIADLKKKQDKTQYKEYDAQLEQLESEEKALKDALGIGKGSAKSGKSGKTDAKHVAEQAYKEESQILHKIEMQKLDDQQESERNALDHEQRLVSILEEGAEKRIRTIELTTNKELQTLREKQRKRTVEAVKADKEAYEKEQSKLDPSKRTQYYESERYKKFLESDGSLKLTITDNDLEKERLIRKKREEDIKQYYKQVAQTYVNGEQKITLIQQKYEKEREAVRNGKEQGYLTESQMAQAIEGINQKERDEVAPIAFEQIAKRIDLDNVVAHASSMSQTALSTFIEMLNGIDVSQLTEKQIDKLKEAKSQVEEIQRSYGNVFQQLQKANENYNTTHRILKEKQSAESIAFNDFRNAKNAYGADKTDENKKKYEEAKKKYEEAKKETAEAQEDADDAQSERAEKVSKIGEKIKATLNIGNALCNTMSKLGVEIPEGVSDVLGGMGELSQGVQAIMSGDILGGISNVIGGIGSLFSGLYSLFMSGAEKAYLRRIDELNSSVSALDDSMQRLNKTMADTSGLRAIDAYTSAMDALQEKTKITSELMLAQLEHWNAKSHSLLYYLNKLFNEKNYDWGKAYSAMATNGYVSSRKGFDWLLGMTPEQLNKFLQTAEGQRLLALIGMENKDRAGYSGEDFIKDLESYADLADAYTDTTESAMEKLNGISLDGLKDELKSLATTTTTSMLDIANSFDEFAREAVYNKMQEGLEKGVSSIYERMSKLNEAYNKGNLSPEEYRRQLQQLKEEYESAIYSAKKQYESELTNAGINIRNLDESASMGGFESMSEDTGTELNGRFAAMQAYMYDVAKNTQALAQIVGTVNPQICSIVDEVRTVQVNSLLELRAIEANTKRVIAPIEEMQENILRIRQNTENL